MRAPFEKVLLIVLSATLWAATAAAQPPPRMKVEGVPEIPRELSARLSQYGAVRSAGFRAWHPSRREMLISTRFGDTSQAHYVGGPGGARRQLTFFPERVSPSRIDPLRGEFFLFTMDKGGSEFYQIYRFDFDAGAAELLTDGAIAFSRLS